MLKRERKKGILDELGRKPWGLAPTLKAWKKHRQESESQIMSNLDTKISQIEALIEANSENEQKFRENQPPHVGEVQKKKQHIAILELARQAGVDPQGIDSLRKDFAQGVKVTGKIRKGYMWPKRRRIPKKGTFFQKEGLRAKPPNWMSNYNIQRLATQMKKLIGDTKSEYVEEEDLNSQAVYAFGVQQGEFMRDEITNEIMMEEGIPLLKKLRGILDWREGNKESASYEKIILPGHRDIEYLIKSGLQGCNHRYPIPAYNKKDVAKDIRRIQKNYNKGHVRKALEKKGRIMKTTPYLSKIDWKAYFYQLAVSEEGKRNSPIAFWDPEVDKYQVALSGVAQMGNLHSVYSACRLSCIIQRILNTVLGIPALIYIDDTIILAKNKKLSVFCTDRVERFYRILGMDLSEKTETMDEESSIPILGLKYTRASSDAMIVEPTEKSRIKAEEAIAKIGHSIEDGAGRGALTVEMMQEATGNLVWSLSPQNLGSKLGVAELYPWTQSKYLKKNVKRMSGRESLRKTVGNLRSKLSNKPQWRIQKEKPRRVVFTDASLEGDTVDLSVLGQFRGTQEYTYWRKRFKKSSFEKALNVKGSGIANYELLAVAMARKFAQQTGNAGRYRWIYKIDNQNVIYWLVKGSSLISRRPLLRGLLKAIGKDAMEQETFCYIPSKLNPADFLTRKSDVPKALRRQLINDGGVWEQLLEEIREGL